MTRTLNAETTPILGYTVLVLRSATPAVLWKKDVIITFPFTAASNSLLRILSVAAESLAEDSAVVITPSTPSFSPL